MTFRLDVNFSDGIDRREIRKCGDMLAADGVCPGCKVTPFILRFSGEHIEDRETLRYNGYCAKCKDPVGYCFKRVETIFGLEEDRAVIDFARGRVYS